MRIHIMDFFDLTEFAYLCPTATSEPTHNSLVLSQNPTNGNFYLVNNLRNIQSATIRISSMNGTTVYQKDNISLLKGDIVHFALSHLPNHTYILQIISNKSVTQKKFVIIN